MHQTISGETRKEKTVSIKNRKVIDDFLKKDNNRFIELRNTENCLYDSFSIDNPVFNYINENSYSKTEEMLKNLIRHQFDECEKYYPYLGDMFILAYHNQLKNNKFKSFLFRKNNVDNFIKTLNNEITKKLASCILENFSLDFVVNLKYKKINQVIVEKDSDLFFEADFDFDYLKNLNFEIKNYNFVLIEGIIDSIGEIHHLLQKASENKEDYVIFCLGVNPSVKETIIKNNRMGITKVHVVSLISSESNLNILNDLAIIHDNADVISATKGQTISQEIRKGLPRGSSIKFEKNGMYIEPLCSKESMNQHKNFLKIRIEESENETNKKLLIERLKKFQTKKLNVYLPDVFKKNVVLNREINYIMRFFSVINFQVCKVKINEKIVFIPADMIKILENKLNNIKKTINNLDKLITLQ